MTDRLTRADRMQEVSKYIGHVLCHLVLGGTDRQVFLWASEDL